MNKILKSAYKFFWVPVMGRIVAKLIPLLEGKRSKIEPTYDIDGDKFKNNKDCYSGKEPP